MAVSIGVAALSGAQYVIDWGDGTQSDQDSSQRLIKSHRYDEAGTYRIVIDGDIGRVYQADGSHHGEPAQVHRSVGRHRMDRHAGRVSGEPPA